MHCCTNVRVCAQPSNKTERRASHATNQAVNKIIENSQQVPRSVEQEVGAEDEDETSNILESSDILDCKNVTSSVDGVELQVFPAAASESPLILEDWALRVQKKTPANWCAQDKSEQTCSRMQITQRTLSATVTRP